MKKNLSSIVVFVMVLAVMVLFSGCEKLKMSNLQANYNLKRANKLYTDEQYRGAIKAYETALELNPKLTFIYKYLGTSYSQVYRPGKVDDERNTNDGNKAVEYLKKALEIEPDNEKIIVALGDIFDKKGNVEEAEKYYLMIKEKAADEPKTYYTLANFYQKNGNSEKAEDMYLQRIELNPEDPDGYHFYVSFLQDVRRWEELIGIHKKRLYAILDSTIILTMREIDKLTKDADTIKKVTEHMKTIKKHRGIDEEERQRLLADSRQRLEGLLSLEETEKKIEELKAELEKKIKRAEAMIEALDSEQKRTVSEIYYAIGNVCWNWSYQTPTNMMDPNERDGIIKKGLAALQRSTEIVPDYANPYAYMGLLWRERIKVNPLKRAEYVKKNEEFNKKFKDIYDRKLKREKLKEELERMGEEQTEGEGT
ncbi:MAG: tetratricopeptide repeat protein [Candidatus Aminicenantes bacterium]|nr:tetratricopeptide repeat protein [Candidatus Aminicenantes bacterium]NIM82211.1 tetratricopeptide repeat protein [Candidatus Aminicenantes bacterium]NIN21613.1 tetratricopeptide repeat protein [Candidatus Aminicenantes bacterium]NIN45422.1 tetratricopeptide repeat protein [Candidatus Aminicenantes bacterium]NIN88243.1 tetratricopeptide repeat protein [Candidatus Aminicenantes bacterium]